MGLNVLWGDGHVAFPVIPELLILLWDIPEGSTAGDLNPETTQIGFDQLWGGSGPETWGLSRAKMLKAARRQVQLPLPCPAPHLCESLWNALTHEFLA